MTTPENAPAYDPDDTPASPDRPTVQPTSTPPTSIPPTMPSPVEPTTPQPAVPPTVVQPVTGSGSESTRPYGNSGATATVADPETARTTSAPVRGGMRMRTVVLGLVLLVIAGAVLIGQLTDLSVDPGAVVLALMIGAGILLIAGARRS
jgi:hypothetical protein